MQRYLIGAFTLMLLSMAPREAAAFDKHARPFGLGLEIGDPTGLTAKYYISPNIAAEAGVGFFGWPFGFGGHIDLHYEFPKLIDTRREAFELPLFIGAGLKAGGYSGCTYHRRYNYCETSIFSGVRVPFGVALQLKKSPVEFQFEVAPAVLVDLGPYYYGLWLDADAALSVRYFF